MTRPRRRVKIGATGIVLPSLIDNFPNACLEAMSQRRMVIGTLGTSLKQLIEDGKSGFLAIPDDANSPMTSCNQLLNLPNEAAHPMTDAAYERLRLLRPDATVTELECFYRETIARFAERLCDRTK